MKIAIIGPGIMPIPPTGWGAVEILIWDQKLALEELGHEIKIVNTASPIEIIREVNSFRPDFVHIQYDDFIENRIDKWICWVCTEAITTPEELVIHTRDIHGVMFCDNSSELVLSDVSYQRIDGERQPVWTYGNFCFKCKAGSDKIEFVKDGVIRCTECGAIDNIFGREGEIKNFWKWLINS